MKVVIYSRVSTSQQAQDGVSLEAQVKRCRSWANGMGYEVIGEHVDAGLSGKRADNRQGLQDALDIACREKAALVVYSLSRLARSTKDALSIAERLRKAGADLVSMSENIDTTSAAGKMVFRMLAVLSEFERDLVSERTKSALSYKRANGYKTGGSIPFGYDVDEDGRLMENQKEQKTIKLIMRLRRRGHSLRTIGSKLHEREISSKNGKAWNPKTIKRILDRESRRSPKPGSLRMSRYSKNS